jgi:hypothetical protein
VCQVYYYSNKVLNAGFAVAPVKEFLGEDYSYAEIRAVMVTM